MQIQAEQAERLEKQKAEQTGTDSVNETNSEVAGNAPEEVKQV